MEEKRELGRRGEGIWGETQKRKEAEGMEGKRKRFREKYDGTEWSISFFLSCFDLKSTGVNGDNEEQLVS